MEWEHVSSSFSSENVTAADVTFGHRDHHYQCILTEEIIFCMADSDLSLHIVAKNSQDLYANYITDLKVIVVRSESY